jgi:SAM-dependent methyltransferase
MSDTLNWLSQKHLEHIRAHFDAEEAILSPSAKSYRTLLAHYYNLLIPPGASVLELGCGDGELLAQLKVTQKTGVDISATQLQRARARLPEARFYEQAGERLMLEGTFDVIIVSDTLNYAADAELLLDRLAEHAHPGTRLLLNYHNNLWKPLFKLAELFGQRRGGAPDSWLASTDVQNLLELSQWEEIKRQHRLLWPFPTPVLSTLLNRWLAPIFPWFGFSIFLVARLRPRGPAQELSVSIVIPARNEAGNIEAAVKRIPKMGRELELIFIEGHSRDETWAEIERVKAAYPDRKIVALRQSGKGKGNAVREAFAVATGDVLMILDADLTMPPEDLPKFYEALASGKAEFANGSRLVYPMEKGAMQFLNMVANKFFGLSFSWLLGQRVKDTLCGTKVLRREHYHQIAANRAYFGDFDPFGDFDLIFGADKLNLKIRDVPIRYRERTYGSTNIQRWRHGLLLFRMLAFAARKLKFI